MQIPHLVELGINAVELLPVFEYDELEFQRTPNPRDHMVNIWGYSHINFFAPMSRYAADGAGPIAAAREFKQMVKQFHKAGIEVILDVVYNHTAEGAPLPLCCGFPSYSCAPDGAPICTLTPALSMYPNMVFGTGCSECPRRVRLCVKCMAVITAAQQSCQVVSSVAVPVAQLSVLVVCRLLPAASSKQSELAIQHMASVCLQVATTIHMCCPSEASTMRSTTC